MSHYRNVEELKLKERENGIGKYEGRRKEQMRQKKTRKDKGNGD
jgi:hypothetical protein